MTIREINRTISTANYATYTISELGGGNIRYKGAQVATLWIKEIDFTGCIIDCEVHFK